MRPLGAGLVAAFAEHAIFLDSCRTREYVFKRRQLPGGADDGLAPDTAISS
jgi:hypothetical protein